MENYKEAVMKKPQNIALSIFIVACLILVACYKPPLSADVPQKEAVQEGKVLYMQHCQKCHPDGEAGLGPSVYYVPGFVKKYQVRHGIGAMPDFDESVISDEELDKIVLYLKALGEEQ